MSYVTIDGIVKSYRKKRVLDGVTLDAEKGELVMVIGANGCGKSTLLSILGGILRPDAGSFCLGGEELFGRPGLLAKKVGLVPQRSALLEELNGRDNLRLWYSREELESSLESGALSALGVKDFLKVPVKKLSGGMKKRIAIGCALAGEPELILLDEPSSALDLPSRRQLEGHVDLLRSRGCTVITVTHEISELSRADRCFVLRNGGLIPCDPADAAMELET